jgi:hypothetical protein
MVDFYITQIRLGKIMLDDVPERFRDAVAAKLGDIEFDSNELFFG